jgi:Tol biopolymer transport system component
MQRPAIDLRRELPTGGRLAGPFDAPPQSFNMTTVPRTPEPGTPTPARDLHPDWSTDERSIVFASNRTARDGAAAGPRFHLWHSSADGTIVTPLANPAEADREQLYPALSPEMGRVAYAGQPAPGAPAQLFVLDLLTGTRTQLTGPNVGVGVGATLSDVTRPTWSPGGDRVAISARAEGVPAAEIYVVEVATRGVAALTRGAEGIESVDPAWSPDGRWIAFASTGKAADENGVFTSGGSDHDLWLVSPVPPQPGRGMARLTQEASDDREPAWSPRAADNSVGLGTGGRALLAFASNRAGSYDIWWLPGLDDKGVPQPESDTKNVARLLVTNDVNPADGTPLGRSQERYPTWARFVTSANVAYQTDATGNGDLWQASVMDIIAPALEAVDEAAGEIVRVTPRLATPGTRVRIEARVRDLQSGPESVWVQVKDPDGKYQGTQDGEHKLFKKITKPLGDVSMEVFEEWECEGVSATSGGGAPVYYRPGATRANPAPTYTPVVDDRVAFTGSEKPPYDGSDEAHPAHWLRLRDDGPAPGGEPAGAVAGDGIYTAEWTTPTDGSDYYLDVIAYDRALDPLGRYTGRGNWKIYDNVGGFSTAPFVASRGVLVVMDNSLGQKALGIRAIPTARGTSLQFTYPSLGVESEILDRDEKMLPILVWEEEVDGELVVMRKPVPGAINNLGPTSILRDNYDLWRVLARGPIDAGTLASYAPLVDRQPDPSQPTNVRTRQVAEHAVLWSAPFAGNVWVGRGSITDPATQALLTAFVGRGGRLWVAGQDVAWALTGHGQSANVFLGTILRAEFVADVPPDDWFSPLLGGLRLFADPAEHPIVRDPLQDQGGFYSPAAEEADPDPLFLADLDSYPFLGTNDVVRATEGGGRVYFYAGAEDAVPDARAGLLAWSDEGGGRHVIFSTFGLEQVGRSYQGEGQAISSLNYRGKLTHAGLCWMTHFAIQGRITDTARRPLGGVVVRAIADPAAGPAGTALTNGDGTYLIRGLPPRPGGYDLEASLTGFLFQHAHVGSEHGLGRRVTRDMVMTRQVR